MSQEWGGSAEVQGGEGMLGEVDGELTKGVEDPGNWRLGAPEGKEPNSGLLIPQAHQIQSHFLSVENASRCIYSILLY